MVIDTGKVWDRATEFLSDELGRLLPYALGAVALPTLGVAALQEVAQLHQGTPLAIGMALGIFVLSLVAIWGQGVVTLLAIDPARSDAPRLAGARLPMQLLVGLLIGLAVLLLVLPVVIAIALSVSVGELQGLATGAVFPQLPPGVVLFLVIYGFALPTALLLVAARLVLVTPVILVEGLGLSSLARAWSLTRGMTGILVGLTLLYALVSGVAALAAKTLIGSVLGLLLGGNAPLGPAWLATAIIVALVQTGFTLLAIAFIAKLYAAARTREAAWRAE